LGSAFLISYSNNFEEGKEKKDELQIDMTADFIGEKAQRFNTHQDAFEYFQKLCLDKDFGIKKVRKRGINVLCIGCTCHGNY
jgi:ABC-type Zn uptake system ZnuABC Zn-binding protein ZnuA